MIITDTFFFRPLPLGKRAIDADCNHIRIQLAVASQTRGDVAKFLGANPSESQRKEQNNRVSLANIRFEIYIA